MAVGLRIDCNFKYDVETEISPSQTLTQIGAFSDDQVKDKHDMP